ncbi:uncharacterized protein RBU33_004341 [Hipposideros larvatus]
MGVTCDRLGRACATLFFGPQRAQLTCPEDEDGRHARCVSRSFSPLRGWRGVGEKRACVHPRRRRGGRPRVRAPRVGASQGSGGAPWRRPLALPGVVSRNTATHAPSGSGLSWKSVAAGSTADSRKFPPKPALKTLSSRKALLQPPGAAMALLAVGRKCDPARPRRFRSASAELRALFTSEFQE